MLKVIVAIGQIAAGVAVGNAAGDALEKYVVKPIEKAIKAKKEGSK